MEQQLAGERDTHFAFMLCLHYGCCPVLGRRQPHHFLPPHPGEESFLAQVVKLPSLFECWLQDVVMTSGAEPILTASAAVSGQQPADTMGLIPLTSYI